jgi:hypothetical protein
MLNIHIKDANSLSRGEHMSLATFFRSMAEYAGIDKTTEEFIDKQMILNHSVPEPENLNTWDNAQQNSDKTTIYPPLDIQSGSNDTTESSMSDLATEREEDETWIEEEYIINPPEPEQEIDASGLPWDGRIHAKNKAKTSSGMWKLARNIPPSLIKSVTKQLRNATVDSVSSLIPKPPSIPKPPKTPSSWLDVPVPMPLPSIPKPMPKPPAIEEPDQFDILHERVMEGIDSKKFTTSEVLAIIRSFKDAAGNTLAHTLGACVRYPHLYPLIHAQLDKISI